MSPPTQDPQRSASLSPDELALKRRLTELYLERDAHGADVHSRGFEEMWREAQVTASTPPKRTLTPSFWMAGLSFATLGLLLLNAQLGAPLSPEQPRGSLLPQLATQAPSYELASLDEDSLTWRDGWLEGEDWSLDWPHVDKREERTPPEPPRGGEREG